MVSDKLYGACRLRYRHFKILAPQSSVLYSLYTISVEENGGKCKGSVLHLEIE